MESFLWYIRFNRFIFKVWEWHVEFAFSYRLEWIEDKTEDRKTLKHHSSKAFLKRTNSYSFFDLSSGSTFLMKLSWGLQLTITFSSSEPL